MLKLLQNDGLVKIYKLQVTAGAIFSGGTVKYTRRSMHKNLKYENFSKGLQIIHLKIALSQMDRHVVDIHYLVQQD